MISLIGGLFIGPIFFEKKFENFQNIFLTITKPVMFNNYSIAVISKGGEKSEDIRTQTSNT